jgi:hypothetical protein
MVYFYGQDFEAEIPFVSGAQFAVDYGPNLTWLADIPLYGAFIGNTEDGLSVGFGFNPQLGGKFPIVWGVCVIVGECPPFNVDGPITREHPLFPDPTPVISRFPDQAVFPSGGARSQTCQLVELDIHPGSCPNPYNIKLFDWADQTSPSILPVAILGSESVDVSEINPATLMLEGVPALRYAYEDVATLDGHAECDCNDGAGDGYMDMTVKFNRQAIAMALMLESWRTRPMWGRNCR